MPSRRPFSAGRIARRRLRARPNSAAPSRTRRRRTALQTGRRRERRAARSVAARRPDCDSGAGPSATSADEPAPAHRSAHTALVDCDDDQDHDQQDDDDGRRRDDQRRGAARQAGVHATRLRGNLLRVRRRSASTPPAWHVRGRGRPFRPLRAPRCESSTSRTTWRFASSARTWSATSASSAARASPWRAPMRLTRGSCADAVSTLANTAAAVNVQTLLPSLAA